MESLRDDNGSRETRSGAGERLSGERYVAPAVGELTERELELQRRLVRESLLVRAA